MSTAALIREEWAIKIEIVLNRFQQQYHNPFTTRHLETIPYEGYPNVIGFFWQVRFALLWLKVDKATLKVTLERPWNNPIPLDGNLEENLFRNLLEIPCEYGPQKYY